MSPARGARHAMAALLVLALGACTTVPAPGCRAGESVAVDDSLFFGMAWRKGVVSADDWARFLAVTVTPRFPQGLTVFEAASQWRDARGVISHEGSRVLRLVHPDDATSEAAIRAIMDAYRTQFEQEAVLRVRSLACSSL